MPTKKCSTCRRNLLIGGHNFVRKPNSQGMGVEGFENKCKRCMGLSEPSPRPATSPKPYRRFPFK